MSFGSEDDADYNNPLRVASRVAIEEYDVELIAAAGNLGPDYSSIMVPACETLVVAAGGIESEFLRVWEYSSRGPTLQIDIKPDFVT